MGIHFLAEKGAEVKEIWQSQRTAENTRVPNPQLQNMRSIQGHHDAERSLSIQIGSPGHTISQAPLTWGGGEEDNGA